LTTAVELHVPLPLSENLWNEIVSGGFAFVFMTQDPSTGKYFALKVSEEII